MDSFFDTCIIIRYASYNELVEAPLNLKCNNYITNKKGRYMLCYYVLDELKNFIKKRALIHKEVLKKLLNFNYSINDFRILSKQDIAYANKLFESNKGKNPEKASKIFFEERNNFQRKIDIFIKLLLDERVIPVDAIDSGIVSILKNFIEKHSDCLVLASAIQKQQNKEAFLFVTCDAHFNPNNYNFIKEDEKLKEYKFPELKNLLFE
jgi:hypothetical protein